MFKDFFPDKDFENTYDYVDNPRIQAVYFIPSESDRALKRRRALLKLIDKGEEVEATPFEEMTQGTGGYFCAIV
jgi:hypothetical protein